MFMKVCHFKVQGSIALNSSIPEANEQYIMFFFKKTAVINHTGFTQETENALRFFLCCMLSFSSPPF